MKNDRADNFQQRVTQRRTKVLLAVLAVLAAAVPGCSSIVYLVLDRTLPVPEGAKAVGAQVDTGEEVFLLEEEDGQRTHFIMTEQGQAPVEEHQGKWMIIEEAAE